MEDWLVPVVGCICVIGLPMVMAIVVLVKSIQAKHAERMAMIDKGVVLEEPEKRTNKYNALRNGLLLIGLAIGAMAGMWIGNYMNNWQGDFMIFIFTVLGGGISFIIYFFVVRYMQEKDN